MRVRVAVAILALSCGIANAADLLRPVAPPPPLLEGVPQVPYVWTGWYIGGVVGSIWGRDGANLSGSDVVTNSAIQQGLVNSPSFSGSGIVGGPLIGGNWQVGQWVLGAEFEFDFSSLNMTSNGDPTGILCTMNGNAAVACPGPGSTAQQFSEKLTDLMLLTGRLGYSFGPVLPYARVGVAFAHVETSGLLQAQSSSCGTQVMGMFNLACPPYQGGGSWWQAGLAAGGGVDWAVNRWLVARIEAVWLGFSGKSYALPSQFDSFAASTNGFSGVEVKGGLIWRFNGPYNGA